MGGPGHDLKDDTDAPTSDEFCCVSLCWTEEWRGSFFFGLLRAGFSCQDHEVQANGLEEAQCL